MKHSVKFNITVDDATGEYGLIPLGCEGFNAFWNGQGIFHDVFEHWFENNHKYFRGKNALNRGGECAAMGAFMYYCEQLEVSNRPLGTYHYFMDSARTENEEALIDGIKHDSMYFGSRLECRVPRQKPVECGDLEYQVNKFWENIKTTPVNRDNKEDCQALKQSITLGKLQSLYRWGYRMAEKLVPKRWENREVCVEFIEFWNEFCKNNEAESLFGMRLEINVYKVKGIIKWNAYLLHDNGKTKIRHSHYILDDIYAEYDY